MSVPDDYDNQVAITMLLSELVQYWAPKKSDQDSYLGRAIVDLCKIKSFPPVIDKVLSLVINLVLAEREKRMEKEADDERE